MNYEGAIAYIRNWREQQNLEPLSPQQERESASKLLFEKGYKLPEFIPDANGKLELKEGAYVSDTTIVDVSIEDSEQLPVISKQPLVTDNCSLITDYPWQPEDKREFWCEKLQSFVRIDGLEASGFYWVIKSGEGHFRRWTVKGEELVLRDNAPQEAPKSELLLINSVSWGDIKNCLVNKFIPSYPWSKKGERSPNQIREDMLAIAKSKRQGLATYIEDERKVGRFDDAQNFTLRMNAVYESFPWGDFAQMIDFN